MKIFIFILLISGINASTVCFSQTKDTSVSEYSGFLTFAGLYQSGNTNKFLVQGKSEIKKEGKYLETILFFSGSYGENKSVKDDNTYYGAFTTDLFYKKTFSTFILEYLEYNYSKGIELRSQTGGGVKYLFIRDTLHKSSVSLALIYDYLNLQINPGNTKSKELRFSFRVKSRHILMDDHLNLSFTGFFQPVVNNFSNANIYIEAIAEAPMTKAFRLNANYNYSFDNTVSAGRKRADNKLTFGAGFYF